MSAQRVRDRAGARATVASRNLSFSLVLVVVLAACSMPGSEPAYSSPGSSFAGTWVGGANEMKIWAVEPERLQVEFSGAHEYQTAAGPMVNVGEAEGFATVEGDAATFRPRGAGRDCVITLRLAGERLQVLEEGECGFGLNVTAAGIYRRVSDEQPEFDLP